MRKPTVIDLFCGAGGFTQGFVDAGLRPVWANDVDPWAVRTYEENFGAHATCGDIFAINIDPDRYGLPKHADVVIGGPPCQGFSNLGKRLPNDPRNQLWRQYLKVVERVNPKVFVVENVPPLLKSEEFAEMVRVAASYGYGDPAAAILNAADYGVPQRRKRAIAIFSRVGVPSLPLPTHSDHESRRESVPNARSWVPLREALEGIRKKPLHNGDVNGTLAPLGGSLLHIGRNPTARSLERYRHVREGGNRWDLPRRLMPECWIKKTKGGTDLFGRLWRDRPAFTIRTEFFKPEKGRYLHPTEDRPITHWEAARIQTFPDHYQFWGPKIEIAKQIGNAVPCKLGEAIAREVLAHIRQSERATSQTKSRAAVRI